MYTCFDTSKKSSSFQISNAHSLPLTDNYQYCMFILSIHNYKVTNVHNSSMQIEGGIVILEEHGSVRILEGEGGDILLYRTFIDKSNKISNSLKSGQFKIHVALPRGIMGVLF